MSAQTSEPKTTAHKRAHKKAGLWRSWRHRRHMHHLMTRELRRSAPGLIPRSLWLVSALFAVAGISAGIAAGAMLAWAENRQDTLREELTEQIEQVAAEAKPPAIPSSPEASATVSEVAIETTGPNGELRRGVGVVVSQTNSDTYILTSYDLAQAATITPPSPISITVLDQTYDAVPYSWNREQGYVLLSIPTISNLLVRPWAPEDSISQDDIMAIPLPRFSPQEPLTVFQVTVNLLGPENLLLRIPNGAPTGAPVIDSQGRLAGVITGRLEDGTYIATRPQQACDVLLECS